MITRNLRWGSGLNKISITLAVSSAFVIALGMPALAAGSELPRYKLAVGQELVYDGASAFKYEGGAHRTTNHTIFWVTDKNPDGSWHVIAHSQSAFTQQHDRREPAAAPALNDQLLDAFDLFPDGRIGKRPEGVREQSLVALWYRLPADASAVKAGWLVEEEPGEKAEYRVVQSDQSKWILEKSEHGLFNEVYAMTSQSTIHFDSRRGLVAKVQTDSSQGYGFKGKGTGTTLLTSTAQKEPAWLAQLKHEVDAFVKAKAIMTDAHKSGAKGTNTMTSGMDRAQEALKLGRDQVQLPFMQRLFDTQIAQLQSSAKYYAERQEKQEQVLNKPAADWDTTDIDGGKHTLGGYRGKVVVMDFWYRGCGWCIKAMPQIKEVVDHYKGKPVAVLGMNTDREEKDARFVVDKLKLNYPTLKAMDLPKCYGVQGFPTLIVVDQKGIVREQHIGYSKTLRDELIKTIDGLLSERGTEAIK